MLSRKEITLRLRVARATHRLSQIEVERRARIHFKTFPKGKYWRIENGYDQASADEQRALARVLGTQPELLFAAVEEQRTA